MSRGRPLRSLQRFLLGWLGGVLLLVWAVQLAAAWQTGHHEAEEITDGQLIAVARLWQATPPQPAQIPASLMAPERVRDYVQDVAVLRWLEGVRVTDTHGLAAQWPAGQPPGFDQLALTHAGQSHIWRVYVTEQVRPEGVDRLAVLMNIDHRVDLGQDMAWHMAVPSLVLLPVALGLMVLALRRGLGPLRDLSDDIAALTGQPGERLLRPHRFEEFDGTVRALHGLMDRLDAQLARERAFTSDLAHELRTPLTALALQAQVASRQLEPGLAHSLEAEALRAGRIVAQLLALARAQSDRPAAAEPVSLHDCATHVLADMAQTALDAGQQLALHTSTPDALVRADATAVELAVRNLLDNALRHTPPGSLIWVSVWQREGSPGIGVEDWPAPGGEGAAPRTDGLGLGLKLVERLVASQGGTLAVTHKPDGGRWVELCWQPLATPLPGRAPAAATPPAATPSTA